MECYFKFFSVADMEGEQELHFGMHISHGKLAQDLLGCFKRSGRAKKNTQFLLWVYLLVNGTKRQMRMLHLFVVMI